MKKFIITTSDRRKYLVISENKNNAQVTFSQNFPSLKVRSIIETDNLIFNIIE